MVWLSSRDRNAATALAAIGYCNPFLPERLELERQALGPQFIDYQPLIHRPLEADLTRVFPNVLRLRQRAEDLAGQMRQRLLAGESVNETDLRLYEDLVLYLLYSRYDSNLDGLATKHLKEENLDEPIPLWKNFLEDHRYFLQLPDRTFPLQYEPSHLFATFFQIQRAFHNVFEYVLGRSTSIARLRAAVWQSIFTHDVQRYARTLFRLMDDVPTLIQGPSGTGKELVAQAISRSRYVKFNSKTEAFEIPKADHFKAVNLSALAPTLIESELFGHGKGAFTNATEDREGWLGLARQNTCIFLDEIGELDLSIQVKLLRVLQSREFHRVGETKSRTFHGKIITATNRNLMEEIRHGRFREDFYYRLCADLIHTPALREQLAERPDDLELLVSHLAGEIIPDDPAESTRLTHEVVEWIQHHLRDDYEWPGNFRELRQCIRNVMIRGCYVPSQSTSPTIPADARQQLGQAVASAKFTLQELIERYVSLAYAMEGTYEAAGHRLGINWRTVRAKVSKELVVQYQSRFR